MTKTARWALAMVLILTGGILARGFAGAILGAPAAEVARAFRVKRAAPRPVAEAQPLLAILDVAPVVAPKSEAPAPPACAPKLHRVPLRGCIPDEGGARESAALAVKDLPPLPPPEEQLSDRAANLRMEQLYADSDYDGALATALSACKRGDSFGCALAGNMQTRGEGKADGAKLTERGTQLLAKSCKMGDTWGCTRTQALEGP